MKKKYYIGFYPGIKISAVILSRDIFYIPYMLGYCIEPIFPIFFDLITWNANFHVSIYIGKMFYI